MKNSNHTFRRFIQKQMIKFFRYLNTEQEKSVYERDCIAVCKKFINQPDSIMLLTPISGKRYIRSEKNEIFIILDSHRVNPGIKLYHCLITRLRNVEKNSKIKLLPTLSPPYKKLLKINYEKSISLPILHRSSYITFFWINNRVICGKPTKLISYLCGGGIKSNALYQRY